jgi:hypothetical protein
LEKQIDSIKKDSPEVQDVIDVFVESCLLPIDDLPA